MEEKDFYAFKLSNELNITSNTLLTIGFIGILFGNFNIKITQFVGTKIEGDPEILKGIILIILLFQIILLLIYTYRDTEKLLSEKIYKSKIGVLQKLKDIKEQIKKEKNENRKMSYIRAQKQLIDSNQKVKLQLFQKYFIYFGLKIILPIFIGYLGVKSIGFGKINEIISFINIGDLGIIILITTLIYFIFLRKLK